MAPTSDSPPFSRRTRSDLWARLKKTEDQIHNVLIVGGGIVGAGIFRETLLHGVPDVWLIEKNDFASGTSGASSKLIHAGLRYLEQSWNHLKALRFRPAVQNFLFVWQASLERKRLTRLAPGLIWSKPIYLVLSEGDNRSPLSVALGVWVYYLMQLIQGQWFPPPRVVFRKNAIRWVAPHLKSDNVKALFGFTDAETDDARLVIETLHWGHRQGGFALNYVELSGLKKVNGLWEARLTNKLTNEAVLFRAKIVVDAAGAFVDDIRRLVNPAAAGRFVDRVAGSHIDIYPAVCDESYYVTAKDGRLVFVLNRREDGLSYSRVGTTERALSLTEPSDAVRPTAGELDYLKHALSELIGDSAVTDASVLRADAGIRPLAAQEAESDFMKSREHRIVEENGVYHLIGVKLTDFRRVASEWFRSVDWKQTDIEISPAWDLSVTTPIRSNGPLYSDHSPADIIRSTMVVKWEDYVERRHGLYPRYLAKHDPAGLRAIFDEVKGEMGWGDSEFRI